MMKHFTSEDWIDYVRELQTPAVAAQMEGHLSDCDTCQKTFSLWAAANDAAAKDLDYAPPCDAARIARSMFEPTKPQSLGGLVAKLIFDSAQQPAPVGIRGSVSICRQLLYQYGQRFIDLRVESHPTSNEVSLTGQIQQSAGQPESIPVALCGGGGAIQHTETNPRGEFHMVFVPAEGLHLEIDINEKKIRVRVPEVSDPGN
jgi:hypothetical protein